MRNFRDTFDTRKRLFISTFFSICMKKLKNKKSFRSEKRFSLLQKCYLLHLQYKLPNIVDTNFKKHKDTTF